MSETESKHNNRSAFGDEITDPHAFARNHPIAPVFGIGVNSATSGDPLWSQTIHQCTARALTAALADALGIELHPAGTAARLSAERSQLLPPRRLRVPPVYRGLPPDVLECLYHTLCRRTYPAEVRNKAFDIMYERDLMDHYTGDLTNEGWGDLTAIEHPEGRDAAMAERDALREELAVTQRALTTCADNLAELTCECRCPWLEALQAANDTLCEQVSTYPCTTCETPHPAECWARWYTDRARSAMQSEREAATHDHA